MYQGLKLAQHALLITMMSTTSDCTGEDPRDCADSEHNTKDHTQTAVCDVNVIGSTSNCDTATTALLSSKPVRSVSSTMI